MRPASAPCPVTELVSLFLPANATLRIDESGKYCISPMQSVYSAGFCNWPYRIACSYSRVSYLFIFCVFGCSIVALFVSFCFLISACELWAFLLVNFAVTAA